MLYSRAGALIAVDTLYDTWKDWAERNGHRKTSKITFGRDLRAVVPHVRSPNHESTANKFSTTADFD